MKSAGCIRAKRSVARKQFCIHCTSPSHQVRSEGVLVCQTVNRALHVQIENCAIGMINTAPLGPNNVQRIRIAAWVYPRLRETGLS